MRHLLLVLVLALTGCASAPTLVSEDAIPELAALKSATNAVPRQLVRVPLADGRRLAVHRLGDPAAARALVLVHGMLSDQRAWRLVAGSMVRQGIQVWLVDLPGCGASDKPSPREYAYTPQAMAADIAAAVSAIEGPRRITLVGHSLGGQIVLRMLVEQPATAGMDRVDSAVLLAGLDISVNKQDAGIRAIATASDARVEIGEITGELDRLVRTRTAESVQPPTPALEEEARIRLEYLEGREQRAMSQAIIRRALPWLPPEERRPDWAAMEAFESRYASIDVPVLIVWGRRDEILAAAMGYKLAAQLPRARLVVMDGVMHSPQTERPRETVAEILRFVDGVGAGR